MRILLPPSEGKAPPSAGPPLDLAGLSFPDLQPIRAQVLDSLTGLCRSDPDRALAVLGIGPALADLVAGNADLFEAPCAPAWRVYTGVLFGSLDIGSLPPGADRGSLLIASAAFGLLHHGDAIPSYRLAGTVRLPGLPTPKRLWGPPLRRVLADLAQAHLIVDMRSKTYADWAEVAGSNWVTIRVMTLRHGRRVPISHHNKSVKGLLARHLVSGPAPADTADLRDALRSAGWEAAETRPGVLEVLHTAPPA
jgi:hypothetical protein